MGVTLVYPSTGSSTATLTLPWPVPNSQIEPDPNQSLHRTPAGVPYTVTHGEHWFRVTRVFESLSEQQAKDLVDFWETIGNQAGEILYRYTDRESGELRNVFCHIVALQEVKQVRNLRDFTVTFEQDVHPDPTSDENSTSRAVADDANLGNTGSRPAITSALTASGPVDTAFSYTITATGTATIAYFADPLPAGLTLTGDEISGTPTETGETEVLIAASNAWGTDSKTLSITITA